MDFFGAQDQARKKTRQLLALYVLALLSIITALYALFVGLLFAGAEGAVGFWYPELFAGIAVVTLIIMGGASVFKWASLRSGGSAVARSLGGHEVQLTTQDPSERQLLNVVEEMAIASGVPMPAVFILEEPSINAFAAGYSLNDAAVAATRGCIEKLSRDELQGVMAHEFSHILNGDMRLNIRLIGPLFGLLVIAFIGRVLMHSGLRRGHVRSRNDGKGQIAIFVLGIGVMIIGYIGVFFGRLIQAAISRQREYLADSAAVQFTRNPAGISGALKRIGHRETGSAIANDHAVDTAHLFFAKALGGGFATHPPLDKRIRAIDPSWDGTFAPPYTRPSGNSKPQRDSHPAQSQRSPLSAVGALAMIGNVSATAVRHAIESRIALHHAFPEALAHATQARELLFALMLHREAGIRRQQLDQLVSLIPAIAADSLLSLQAKLGQFSADQQFSLLNLLFAPLKSLAARDLQQLPGQLQRIAQVSGDLTTKEALIIHVVSDQLQPGKSGPVGSLQEKIGTHERAVARVLAFVATLQSADQQTAVDDFQRVIAGDAALAGLKFPADVPDAGAIYADLAGLRALSFALRKVILQAAATLILVDGEVIAEEWNALSLIALMLECPLPPLDVSVSPDSSPPAAEHIL